MVSVDATGGGVARGDVTSGGVASGDVVTTLNFGSNNLYVVVAGGDDGFGQ